jgi:hypothetical protein
LSRLWESCTMQIESLYAISGEDTGYRTKTLDLKKNSGLSLKAPQFRMGDTSFHS